MESNESYSPWLYLLVPLGIAFVIWFLRDIYPFALWLLRGRPKQVGPVKRRNPWVSFILTQICPGVGPLYNDDFRWVYFSVAASIVVALVSELWLFDSLKKLLVAVCFGLIFDLALSVQAFVKSRRIQQMELKMYQRGSVYVLLALLVYGVPDGYGFLYPSRVRSFQIPSESMVPNLLVGDRLVADGWAYWHKDPQRGDIIVFDYPREPSTKFVKRLVGLPGDRIEMKHGELYLNNQLVPQTRTATPLILDHGWRAAEYMENLGGVLHTIHRAQPENDRDFGPVSVPEGEYFMMGDNRDRSSDSRVWGFVKRDALIGRMAYVYFSWDSDVYQRVLEERPGNFGPAVMAAIRWDRMGVQVH
jgi:signal peptidase I